MIRDCCTTWEEISWRPSSCTPSAASPTRKEFWTSFQPGRWYSSTGVQQHAANTTVRATRDGSLKWVGVLLILDGEELASREPLLKINITLQTLWACTIVLVKPWTSRVKTERRDDGTVPYRMIPDIADEINQAGTTSWGGSSKGATASQLYTIRVPL